MNKWALEYCEAEFRYIKSIDPTSPGKTFNHERECFASYCNMQANVTMRAGFPLIAHECHQSRDIAMPDFKSAMRAKGWVICGSFAFAPGIRIENYGFSLSDINNGEF